MKMTETFGGLRFGIHGVFHPHGPHPMMAFHGGHDRGPAAHRDGPGGGHRGGPGFGGFPGPMFRRGRKAGRGDVRAATLSLLTEQPLHGYQIIQEIAARSGDAWKPSAGSIYPMLQQLTDEGLIQVEEHDGRRVFSLTEVGSAYVAERQDEFAAVWESVNDTADDEMREMRDLVRQVGIAVMQVAQAGTTAQVAAARQVLAGTRKQLYRILAEDEPADQAQDASTTDRA